MSDADSTKSVDQAMATRDNTGEGLRLGVSTWVYGNIPPQQAIIKLSEKGFHLLELWGDQYQLDPRNFPSEGLGRLRQLQADLRLDFHSLHAPFTGVDLANADVRKREEAVGWMRKAAEYAAQLGCQYVVIHPGTEKSTTVEQGISKVKERLEDSLNAVGQEAESRGMGILLENMSQTMGRRYGSRVRDLVDLIQTLDTKGHGICLDPGHTVLSGLDVHEEIKEADKLLMSLHANDNDGQRDLHLVPLRSKANIDWKRFMRSLRAAKYIGPFMLEVYGGEETDEALDAARRLTSILPGILS